MLLFVFLNEGTAPFEPGSTFLASGEIGVSSEEISKGGDGQAGARLILFGARRQEPPVPGDLLEVRLAYAIHGVGRLGMARMVLEERTVAVDGLHELAALEVGVGDSEIRQCRVLGVGVPGLHLRKP